MINTSASPKKVDTHRRILNPNFGRLLGGKPTKAILLPPQKPVEGIDLASEIRPYTKNLICQRHFQPDSDGQLWCPRPPPIEPYAINRPIISVENVEFLIWWVNANGLARNDAIWCIILVIIQAHCSCRRWWSMHRTWSWAWVNQG